MAGGKAPEVPKSCFDTLRTGLPNGEPVSGLRGAGAAGEGLAACEVMERGHGKELREMGSTGPHIKIAFIGGGSQTWAPSLIRDIIFKREMREAELELALLDVHAGRARVIKRMFEALLGRWGIKRVRLSGTQDPRRALKGADFVLIAISTGGLEAMAHDLEIPEQYGIYHTVGDTVGPGGWARALRNIPVFRGYAEQIKELAPEAFVLNYSNPLGALTKVLSDELGQRRVVGLCHGVFETHELLQGVFGLRGHQDLRVEFGGLNHFFWVLDFQVKGEDGYALLRRKLGRGSLYDLLEKLRREEGGRYPPGRLASDLLSEYGYLSYVADRHTCEFFGCYITNQEVMKRYELGRTSVADRRRGYTAAAERIEGWRDGTVRFDRTPSRETAADIMAAITFGEGFTDVVNVPNIGQIPNLPLGAVLETMGYVDGGGVRPLTLGPLPEQIRALCAPHAEVQIRTVEAGLRGDLEGALMALLADPVCAALPARAVKEMGRKLLEANAQYLPQFFG